jgi:hypothetical protein
MAPCLTLAQSYRALRSLQGRIRPSRMGNIYWSPWAATVKAARCTPPHPSILHTCRRPRSTNPSHLCSGLYLMMLLRLLLILRRRDPEQLDMALRRATTNCSLAAGPKDFPSCAHRSYR